MPNLGEYVRQYRVIAGLTQRALGQAVGKSAAFISLVEQGKSEPSIGVLRKIAAVLHVPVAALFDGLNETAAVPAPTPSKTEVVRVVHPEMRKRYVNPSRPANTMRVGIRAVRHIVVDDVGNTQNINTAGSNIGRYQNLDRAVTEACKRSLSLALG